MAYYGGIEEDTNDVTIHEFDEPLDNSNNRLFSSHDEKSNNRNNADPDRGYIYDYNGKKVEHKPGLIEKNELKEIQVYDVIANKNLENIPTTVKVPTVNGDEFDLLNKVFDS